MVSNILRVVAWLMVIQVIKAETTTPPTSTCDQKIQQLLQDVDSKATATHSEIAAAKVTIGDDVTNVIGKVEKKIQESLTDASSATEPNAGICKLFLQLKLKGVNWLLYNTCKYTIQLNAAEIQYFKATYRLKLSAKGTCLLCGQDEACVDAKIKKLTEDAANDQVTASDKVKGYIQKSWDCVDGVEKRHLAYITEANNGFEKCLQAGSTGFY